VRSLPAVSGVLATAPLYRSPGLTEVVHSGGLLAPLLKQSQPVAFEQLLLQHCHPESWLYTRHALQLPAGRAQVHFGAVCCRAGGLQLPSSVMQPEQHQFNTTHHRDRVKVQPY
jgi:hypothetical protein